MRIKKGVIMPRRAEIYPVLWAAEKIWVKYGRPEGVTVTSGIEGRHSWGSKHFSDDALDFRVRYWTKETATAVAKALRKKVGKNYDIVLEWNKIHIHCEYQPKEAQV